MKRIYYFLFSLLLFSCSNDKEQKSPVDYVNPFIGTGFHGHTYPGATVPFGAVQLSPDTRRGDWDASSGYHYSDSSILGFSHTHLSGTGCIDLGDILLHPTTQELKLVPKGDIYSPLAFSHADETASPGYYSVDFKNEQIKAELTATTYVGVHRYTFPKDKMASIVIDPAHSLAEDDRIYELELKQTANNELEGVRRTGSWVDNQRVYFVAQFSKPFHHLDFVNAGVIVSAGSKLTGTNIQAVGKFDVTDGQPVIVKVALSIVSIENARENLKHDVTDFDFDAVHKNARVQWEQALSDIVVEGGTEAELINFYTAAYHTKVVPNIVSDANGDFRRNNDSIAKVPQGQKRYSTFSLWDTFRAWHPLMTLTDTTLVNNMVCSFLDIYDATGELPVWPLSSGETGTMIGYHSVSVISDAYMKGIRGFDAEKALEAMKVSSEKNKKGADYYIKYGFIPSNIKRESVSCLLEFAYDDWAIAQLAKALGKDADYKTYIERSQNYIHVFDGSTKFFRGKRMDGNWDTPFNAFEPGRNYTEATAWQYRFFAPHDVNGMIQLFGGQDEFIHALDDLFTVESKVEGEMSDITGLIGQYAHGNEPSHHMAYLYNYAGQPWKTQELTRRILHEMYQPTPEGISGNEDCGQMSAWYVLSSLGLYSVCPGSNEFALTAPLFEKATIRLANGKTLNIIANEPAKNKYIEKVQLNGKEITSNFITYSQIMEGGELTFVLSSQPNKQRGISAEAAPYSLTQAQFVSIPYVEQDLNLFLNEIEVTLASATKDAVIRYTLDGSEPTEQSPVYSKSFVLNATVTVKAKGFKEGYEPSYCLSIDATKAVYMNGVTAETKQNGTNYRYFEGNFRRVADLDKLTATASGILPEPTIGQSPKADHFGYIFSGVILAPEDGIYEFQTKSDDGSVLYIGKDKVVDNDGSHAAISATGKIALKKGCHPYKLCYFEDYEGEHLSWGWKTPGSSDFTTIPTSNLFLK